MIDFRDGNKRDFGQRDATFSEYSLANNHFVMQSNSMENDWAAEHLQTIRTLMERSAVYRRALAPIMVWNGIIGIAGGGIGWRMGIHSNRAFVEFWSSAAVLAIIGSFLLVRRQALRDSEPFWSPPTRRIAQALLPPLVVGGFLNAVLAYMVPGDSELPTFLIVFWLWFYGCASHAASFFMMRGMRLFAWLFILTGGALFTASLKVDGPSNSLSPCLLMGLTFGLLHLAYGIYLYVTEKGKNAA